MLKYKNIVCTGPESSGKSTLVKALADHFDLPYLNEYARDYLHEINRPYTEDDVKRIGMTQLEKESIISKSNPLSILDTDWLTIEIWMLEKYGISSGLDQNISGKIYLLLYPDIPWTPDPLRENPDDRLRLYHRYEDFLIQKNAVFYTVKNTDRGRVASVINFLEPIIS